MNFSPTNAATAGRVIFSADGAQQQEALHLERAKPWLRMAGFQSRRDVMFIEPRMFYFSNAGGVACGLLFGAITYRVTCHADGVGGDGSNALYKHFIPTGFYRYEKI